MMFEPYVVDCIRGLGLGLILIMIILIYIIYELIQIKFILKKKR